MIQFTLKLTETFVLGELLFNFGFANCLQFDIVHSVIFLAFTILRGVVHIYLAILLANITMESLLFVNNG